MSISARNKNRRYGEDFPRAKLSDHDVELLRELRAAGMSYRELAAKFEISLRQAWRIGTYRSRATVEV